MLFYSTRTLKRKKEGEASKKKIPQIFHHKDLLRKSAKNQQFSKNKQYFLPTDENLT